MTYYEKCFQHFQGGNVYPQVATIPGVHAVHAPVQSDCRRHCGDKLRSTGRGRSLIFASIPDSRHRRGIGAENGQRCGQPSACHCVDSLMGAHAGRIRHEGQSHAVHVE